MATWLPCPVLVSLAVIDEFGRERERYKTHTPTQLPYGAVRVC